MDLSPVGPSSAPGHRRPRRPSAGGNWPRNPLLPLLLFLFPFPPFPPFFFSLLFPSFLLSFALISLNFFALRVKYTAPRFFFALRAKNTAPNFFSPLRGVWGPRSCGTLVHRLRGLRGVRRAWDPRHLPRRNAGFFSSARGKAVHRVTGDWEQELRRNGDRGSCHLGE